MHVVLNVTFDITLLVHNNDVHVVTVKVTTVQDDDVDVKMLNTFATSKKIILP